MTVELDHVSLRTADVDRLTRWYGRILGLTPGPRPAFDFPGAWLYAGDRPVIHLIGTGSPPGADAGDLRIEHFALRGSGLGTFLALLEREGIAPRITRMPPGPVDLVLVNLTDPDGNHLHVDFPADEAAPG